MCHAEKSWINKIIFCTLYYSSLSSRTADHWLHLLNKKEPYIGILNDLEKEFFIVPEKPKYQEAMRGKQRLDTSELDPPKLKQKKIIS